MWCQVPFGVRVTGCAFTASRKGQLAVRPASGLRPAGHRGALPVPSPAAARYGPGKWPMGEPERAVRGQHRRTRLLEEGAAMYRALCRVPVVVLHESHTGRGPRLGRPGTLPGTGREDSVLRPRWSPPSQGLARLPGQGIGVHAAGPTAALPFVRPGHDRSVRETPRPAESQHSGRSHGRRRGAGGFRPNSALLSSRRMTRAIGRSTKRCMKYDSTIRPLTVTPTRTQGSTRLP